MKTDIYIISGFLGAGKTTLIQKLLRGPFANRNVVLIENDFGETSVDSALLQNSGFRVKELTSGCICCTLSGDFVKSTEEILTRYQPEILLIEPSGVGKLSDIISACKNPRIIQKAFIRKKITVADVKRCEMYLENFGEFFEDQIQHADTVIFSRTKEYPQKVVKAMQIINQNAPKAAVVAENWDTLNLSSLISSEEEHKNTQHEKSHNCNCHSHNCTCNHTHENCTCGHKHSAEEFDTITLDFSNDILDISHVCDNMKKLESLNYGMVLRAKGILKQKNGYINLQYLPNDLSIQPTSAQKNMLCIIGKNLKKDKIQNLFLVQS